MTALNFTVTDAAAEPYAAIPLLAVRLHVDADPATPIHSIALYCQIRIEPHRRRYTQMEEARLLELFGETPRWGDTLKPFLWTHCSALIPSFTGRTEVELHVPCSYDFEVAAAKYLHGLADGEIPLLLLFSGTIFAKTDSGLQVTRIPWDREARYRLPVRVWRELMDLYYPNTGWLRLRRDTMDALLRFKATHAIATWDGVMDTLLDIVGERAA